MSYPFQASLAFGQAAEGKIARYLRSQGHYVLPAYDLEYEISKGPRLFGRSKELIAPDFVDFTGSDIRWVECKCKTVFSWHRKSQKWVTGIDSRYWEHYCEVADCTHIPVWLLFLHQSSIPNSSDREKGCPTECPTGLFGNSVAVLRNNINHRSPSSTHLNGWGSTGMVYWAHSTLRQLATLENFMAAIKEI
jgi:hypothetical protein